MEIVVCSSVYSGLSKLWEKKSVLYEPNLHRPIKKTKQNQTLKSHRVSLNKIFKFCKSLRTQLCDGGQ